MKKIILWLVSTFLIASTAQAGVVTPQLQEALSSRASDKTMAVIIKFSDRLGVTTYKDPNPTRRRSRMVKDLKQIADQAQALVRARLTHSGAERVIPLWLTNSLAATVRGDLVDELAGYPGVESVHRDEAIRLPLRASPGPQPPAGWNLTAIGAPDLWALGFTGQGIVVATMDTGVDLDHPALGPKWRGGTNSWFDPHGEHPTTPIDLAGSATGHGTQTMGIIVAGEAGGQAIGVAPGAQWIAVKVYNDKGEARLSDIHQGFQWILDPDGDPSTDDAPDVVNNSWGLQNTVNACDLEFHPDIDALRAAGIAVVFAAGNSGPREASSMSPANNPGSMAVGALDETFTIYEFSGRGPSACASDMFPNVVAPGVDVMTTDLSFGGILTDPVLVTGTSASAPHLAGGIALLKSAFRDVNLPELESAILETAQDLGDPGRDNVYGAGMLDVVAAYDRLAGHIPSTDTVQIVGIRYHPKRHQLYVQATSDAAPAVTLTLPEYRHVAMEFNKKEGIYETLVRGVWTKPATVTVDSSGGGSDTKPVPFPAAVHIIRTRYHAERHRLLVQATSDAAPAVTLTLPEYGKVAMDYKKKEGIYETVVKGVWAKPATVTVDSSGGGSDTKPVPFKRPPGLTIETRGARISQDDAGSTGVESPRRLVLPGLAIPGCRRAVLTLEHDRSGIEQTLVPRIDGSARRQPR